MQPCKRSASAFTLVEMMVVLGVVLISGGAIFTLMTMGMTLYTQNVSISQTHFGGLVSMERLLSKVATAEEVPVLVDDTGATVSGNGPAAGVLFYYPASSQTYTFFDNVDATATTFKVATSGGQPAPQAGDKITMYDLGFQGVITSAALEGNKYRVTLASSAGNGFAPIKTSGTVIPKDSKFFLLSPSAFISVSGVLRYYPRALSVAGQGANTFNNASNFDVSGTLLPASGQTNCFPFQYLDTARRSVTVTMPIRAPAYGSRISNFYTFQNLKTAVAYRSAAIR